MGSRLRRFAGVLCAVAALAGVALAAALTAGATPARRSTADVRASCSLSRSAGEIVTWSPRVTIVGQGSVRRRPVRRRQIVATNRKGEAQLCIKRGRWRCTMRPSTRVMVEPADGLVIRLERGEAQCAVGSNAPQKLRTGNAALTVGGTQVAAFASADAGASTGGRLLTLSVNRSRTLVKMQRGSAILARPGTDEGALVVAKQQQATMPRSGGSGNVAAIRLTRVERANLKRLARTLPREVDTQAPTIRPSETPDARWSLRSARVAFDADESVAFSCAIDSPNAFRLCTSPHTFTGLEPGPRTLFVRATDPAGNSSVLALKVDVDASRIAFASQRDGNPELYRIDPDRTHSTRLTNDPSGRLQSDENPDWSPGHTRIVFDRLPDQSRNQDIYVINADGTGETRLTTHAAVDRNPSWSPDGTKIAFESYRDGNREIYVLELAKGSVVRVTNDPAEDLDPTWAPDSRRIAFISRRTGAYDLYVTDTTRIGPVTQLTADDAVDLGPTWSSRDVIAFHSNRTQQYANIFVIAPTGGAPQQVTKTQQADENPSWAPDGRHLVYQSLRKGSHELVILDVRTGEETELTAPQRDYVPDW